MGKASRVKAARRAAGDPRPAAKSGVPRWVFPAVIVALVVVGGVLALALSGGHKASKGTSTGNVLIPPTGSIQVGNEAPNFKVPALVGTGSVTLAQTRGKPTLLVFWAHWCPHCQKELPLIERLARAGESVISVSTSPREQDAPAKLMRDDGITFPTGQDTKDNGLLQAYGVQGFPTMFILDSKGIVRERLEGEAPVDQLKSKLDALG